MCRHFNRSDYRRRHGHHGHHGSSTDKTQACIQCALERPQQQQQSLVEEHIASISTTRNMETNVPSSSAPVPETSFQVKNEVIKYVSISDHEIVMEVFAFVEAFCISRANLESIVGISNVVYVEGTNGNNEKKEIWVTVCPQRLEKDGIGALLNPNTHPFFYKFIRGECSYGFGYAPPMHHAINRCLYVFKFELISSL